MRSGNRLSPAREERRAEVKGKGLEHEKVLDIYQGNASTNHKERYRFTPTGMVIAEVSMRMWRSDLRTQNGVASQEKVRWVLTKGKHGVP